MGRVTDRYMCLGCGRFWRTSNPITPGEHCCPHCGDRFWVDNVQPNSPPALFDDYIFICSNNHSFSSDTPGDVQFCTFCGIRVASSVGDETLLVWQIKELERLGL